MRFHYDPKSDALYIRFNEKRYVESEELSDGIIFDYNRSGKIIGIEVLEASKRFPSEFRAQFRGKKFPAVLDVVRKSATVR